MNLEEFAKKYLNIELKPHQIKWLEHIKDMKNPIIIMSPKGRWMIVDKEKEQ